MTNLYFILSPNDSGLNRLDFLGSLLGQCLQHNLSPFCLVSDSDYAEFLDDYLWSSSFLFLPHLVISQPQKHILPQVYIGTELSFAAGCQVLFNCSNQALSEFLKDKDIEYMEWMSNDANEKAHMRKIFKQYQSNKITPKLIRM